MAKDIISYRQLSKRPISAYKKEDGGYGALWEVSFRGMKMKVTTAQKQRIEDAVADFNNPEVGSVRQRRKWAKEFEREIVGEVSARQQKKLASYLSRIPSIVTGMLAKAQSAKYFSATTSRYLEEIIAITLQMSDWEREQFYIEYGDLFSDITDYYELLRRYSYSPGKTFALTEQDMERLHQKGYSSFESYKSDMEKNIKYVRDVLKKDYKKYYKNYKEGGLDIDSLFED